MHSACVEVRGQLSGTNSLPTVGSRDLTQVTRLVWQEYFPIEPSCWPLTQVSESLTGLYQCLLACSIGHQYVLSQGSMWICIGLVLCLRNFSPSDVSETWSFFCLRLFSSSALEHPEHWVCICVWFSRCTYITFKYPTLKKIFSCWKLWGQQRMSHVISPVCAILTTLDWACFWV